MKLNMALYRIENDNSCPYYTQNKTKDSLLLCFVHSLVSEKIKKRVEKFFSEVEMFLSDAEIFLLEVEILSIARNAL